MKKFFVSKSVRLRGSSFTSRIEKQGVKSYTVYNHMLLPTTFSSPEDEYKHLKTHVQIWDVSVQREIEITGKEAYELVQLMSCRDLSKAKIKKVMGEFKRGTLKKGKSKKKVTNRKQAIAIALSEARRKKRRS